MSINLELKPNKTDQFITGHEMINTKGLTTMQSQLIIESNKKMRDTEFSKYLSKLPNENF